MSVRLFIRKSVLWTTKKTTEKDNILASGGKFTSASISSYIVSKTTMQYGGSVREILH